MDAIYKNLTINAFNGLKKFYNTWALSPEAPTDFQIQVVDGQVLIYDKNIKIGPLGPITK